MFSASNFIQTPLRKLYSVREFIKLFNTVQLDQSLYPLFSKSKALSKDLNLLINKIPIEQLINFNLFYLIKFVFYTEQIF